jgi:signal transduction histidine kinase
MRARSEYGATNVGGSEGGRDWEDFLAHARLILAAVCTVIVSLNPACLGGNIAIGRLLIFIYLLYSLSNLVIVRFSPHRGLILGLCLGNGEIVITSLIIMFTGGAQSYFLGLYLFVLLAAACMWGFDGALLSSCACVVFLFANMMLPSSWFGIPSSLTSEGISAPAAMALSATLVSSASLLGLLVERDNKQYVDALVVTRLVRSVMPEPSFKATLENTLLSMRDYFDADMIRLAIQEIGGERAIAWEVTRVAEGNWKSVRSWPLSPLARAAYFACAPEKILRRLGLDRITANHEVTTEKGNQGASSGSLSGAHRLAVSNSDRGAGYDLEIVSENHAPLLGPWSLLATTFSFEKRWLGRLTIYNSRSGRDAKADARLLGALVREVGPAVYGKFLVGRLRSQVQAKERVRLVQELHDGVIQSLIGLEMQIDLLRRTRATPPQSAYPQDAMGHLQELVHNEIANLREEMQRIRPLAVDSHRFLDYLAGTVDRFSREQGISATLVEDSPEILLSSRACSELVRIVQEALVNVRKHSAARAVVVRFWRENQRYMLSVEDNGRGFGFTGRRSSAELEGSSHCPLIIKERVSAIGGELVVESIQGSGARLEVSIPLTPDERVSSDD